MKRLPDRVGKRKAQEPIRDAILRIIKLNGSATVNELCRRTKLTHTGIRRYLAELTQKGLIDSVVEQQAQGRPCKRYKLTNKATLAFPTGYEQLADDMLSTVFETDGHKSVMDFLKANNDRLIKELEPRFAGKCLLERVEEMARYFVDNGYMTEWMRSPDGDYFLYHQNCSILHAASKYRQFCILEPRLIECLLRTKIFRRQYMLKGDPVCGYQIVDDLRDADHQT